MEELNKNQIVLLTLLVSFITSIATGIVTVTLMDQAPAAVTQTINRVVERTVEKVVPRETQVSTVIREVPVIVTEEELIVKVINGAAPAVAKIVEATEAERFLGSGFLVGAGRLVTSRQIFSDLATSTAAAYRAVLPDGRRAALDRFDTGDSPLAIFQLAAGPESAGLAGASAERAESPVLKLASAAPMIGQTVVALGLDRSELSVSVGIISSFLSSGTSTAPLVMSNAAGAGNLGGPLLNTKGEVIGVNYSQGLALPAETIVATLDSLPK